LENNEVLTGIRYALHLKNAEVLELILLGGGKITPFEVVQILKTEEQPEYLPCKTEWLHQFFDGLISKRRGSREGSAPAYDAKRIDNNMILRKIRIAFELKDTDVISVLKKTGFNVSTGELGAMARKKDHEKFMKCGDQLLRYLLRGLAIQFRPKDIVSKADRKASESEE